MTAEAGCSESPEGTWVKRYRSYLRRLNDAQKPGGGVPAYMRWINRGGARVVAAFAAAVGWTPNTVTALSACLSATGLVILVVVPPSVIGGLVVGFLLALGFLFDSADGQVSRVTNASSKTGEWVDHVADAFRSPAIHLITAVSLWWHRPDMMWLALVALVYAWVTSAQFLSQILAEQFIRTAGRPQTRGGTLRSFILLPTDPGVLCWSFALWGFASVFAGLYTFLALVAVLHSSVSLTRRYRDLKALDDVSRKTPHA